jgi:hypothetical protein
VVWRPTGADAGVGLSLGKLVLPNIYPRRWQHSLSGVLAASWCSGRGKEAAQLIWYLADWCCLTCIQQGGSTHNVVCWRPAGAHAGVEAGQLIWCLAGLWCVTLHPARWQLMCWVSGGAGAHSQSQLWICTWAFLQTAHHLRHSINAAACSCLHYLCYHLSDDPTFNCNC